MRMTNLKLWVVKEENRALNGALEYTLSEKEQIVLNVLKEFPNLNRKKSLKKQKFLWLVWIDIWIS